MASPWKFLARLISPGSEQKRGTRSSDKVMPDALGIADPTKKPAEKGVNSADQPAGDELHRRDQAAAISAESVRSHEAESRIHDPVDGEDMEAGDPAASGGTGFDVTAAHGAAKIKRVVEIAPRKQRRRSKKAAAITSASQIFQGVTHRRRDKPR